MARNGKSPKANSKDPRDWSNFEFTDIRLSEADKTHFKELAAESSDELFDAVTTLVEGGYKLSCSYDERNKCFIASLTCKEPTDDNYGYVLTSRSDDFYEAVLLGAFKTQYMCRDGVWPKEPAKNNWG